MRTRRYVQAAKATALSAVVILSGLAGVGPAAATDLQCGSVITTDTTLTHDILGCKRTALVIGADNVTLNLGGFLVGGLRAEVTTTISGIDTQGHSGVVVTNGIVKGFDYGVRVDGPDEQLQGLVNTDDTGGTGNSIRGLVIKANGINIRLEDTANTTVSDNKIIIASSSGLAIVGGRNISILNNKIYNNRSGGVVGDGGSAGHLIQGNKITYNGLHGVYTRNDMTVSDNYISHNNGGGIVQNSTHGGAVLTISGNLICDNARGGIVMNYEGHTITDNNVGAGTTGCLPNAPQSSVYYDLYDRAAAQEDPEDLVIECRSTWRNNYTEGDTFNHPCVTK